MRGGVVVVVVLINCCYCSALLLFCRAHQESARSLAQRKHGGRCRDDGDDARNVVVSVDLTDEYKFSECCSVA